MQTAIGGLMGQMADLRAAASVPVAQPPTPDRQLPPTPEWLRDAAADVGMSSSSSSPAPLPPVAPPPPVVAAVGRQPLAPCAVTPRRTALAGGVNRQAPFTVFADMPDDDDDEPFEL
jgi:hypothetical protein